MVRPTASSNRNPKPTIIEERKHVVPVLPYGARTWPRGAILSIICYTYPVLDWSQMLNSQLAPVAQGPPNHQKQPQKCNWLHLGPPPLITWLRIGTKTLRPRLLQASPHTPSLRCPDWRRPQSPPSLRSRCAQPRWQLVREATWRKGNLSQYGSGSTACRSAPKWRHRL